MSGQALLVAFNSECAFERQVGGIGSDHYRVIARVDGPVSGRVTLPVLEILNADRKGYAPA